MALYDDLHFAAGEYAYAAQQLMECETDEEYTGAIDTLLSMFSEADEQVSETFGSAAKILRNMQARYEVQKALAATRKAEYDRLMKFAKATENAIERMKRGVCSAMECNGLQKIRTPIGTWFTKDQIKVEITDPYAIPAEFANAQPPKPDLNAIKKHFSFTGEIIPGAECSFERGVQFR